MTTALTPLRFRCAAFPIAMMFCAAGSVAGSGGTADLKPGPVVRASAHANGLHSDHLNAFVSRFLEGHILGDLAEPRSTIDLEDISMFVN